jgi:hypothetical protein
MRPHAVLPVVPVDYQLRCAARRDGFFYKQWLDKLLLSKRLRKRFLPEAGSQAGDLLLQRRGHPPHEIRRILPQDQRQRPCFSGIIFYRKSILLIRFVSFYLSRRADKNWWALWKGWLSDGPLYFPSQQGRPQPGAG